MLPEEPDEDASWMALGNCRGTSVNEWFPERGQSIKALKRICAGCEVREECLEYALRHRIKHGIWGGTGEKERRRLRRERGYAA
jgi:WhiB family transcriptional regulator, redox-sensing transcriptional regulator